MQDPACRMQNAGIQLGCTGMLSFLSEAATKEAQGTPHSISSALWGRGGDKAAVL